jgi:L-serine dehydratase
MAFVSIFNDVLGPVMRGPSSSHTAGAYHIARLACALAGGRPRRIRCVFDPQGSYAPTYRPLGVDLAFAAGILGWPMTDARYAQALAAAADAGTDIRFEIEPLEHADHPNAVDIDLEIEPGNRLTIHARSVGGGLVELTRLGDWEIGIDGKSWALLILADDSRRVEAAARSFAGGEVSCRQSGGRVLWQVLLRRAPDSTAVDALSTIRAVQEVRACGPVFYAQAGEALFSSAADMLAAAAARDRGLGSLAREYEARLLGLSETDVDREMARRYEVMKASIAAGLDDRRVAMVFTEPSASRIWRAEESGGLPIGGLHSRAAARAMAVMHACNSRGVVCAAPTGGSAGVVPAVLATLEDDRKLPRETILGALLAAGAVGVIVAQRATFAAEIAGCQVEIGVAGAMAAAAVVDAFGGSAAQAAQAAAVALQNTMGSVCDPVGGGCEIPCHTRNAAAAAAAFVMADLVLGGYTNPIGLDETIDASYAVGQALPSELRCTALGGIAATPSGRALAARPRQA